MVSLAFITFIILSCLSIIITILLCFECLSSYKTYPIEESSINFDEIELLESTDDEKCALVKKETEKLLRLKDGIKSITAELVRERTEKGLELKKHEYLFPRLKWESELSKTFKGRIELIKSYLSQIRIVFKHGSKKDTFEPKFSKLEKILNS